MDKYILSQDLHFMQNDGSGSEDSASWIDTIDVDVSSSSNDIFNQVIEFACRENVIAVLIYVGHQMTGFDKKLVKQVFDISDDDLDAALEDSLFEDAPSCVAFL